jgi:nitroreductase
VEEKDFAELVRSSRTRRRFDETKPVSRETLRNLVDVARFAPTGNNTQLLRFHLVSGEEDCAKTFGHLKWAALLKDWAGPAAGERPTGYIFIMAPEKAVNNPIRCYDAGIAAQTIMLAAAAEGLGGCILKNFDRTLIDDAGLAGSGLAISLVLALGVPAENVVLEPATTEHKLAYWHEADGSHHVPKLAVEDLLV